MKSKAQVPTPTATVEETAAKWVARRDAGFSPAEERDFQRWLEFDPRHRDFVAQFESAWSALARPTQLGVGDELEQLLKTLAARRRRRKLLAGGTGLAALLLMAGLFVRRTVRQTPSDEHRSVVVLLPEEQSLPDGSVVQLKSGTQITVEFGRALRRVVLRNGEAHFAVQKNPARPFIVSAGAVDVRAVGTAFDVRFDPAEVVVMVTEGRVSVESPATAAPADKRRSGGPETRLETARTPPGEAPPPRTLAVLGAANEVVLELDSGVPVASTVHSLVPTEASERLAWRSPRLEFTRTPLIEAVSMLNRHGLPSGARLVVDDPGLADVRVTGVFRADDTAGFVFLLESGFGVKPERSGNSIRLHRAP